MDWCDEEFFALGAYQSDLESGKILLAKGGQVEKVKAFSPFTGTSFYLKDFFTDQYLQYRPRETRLVSSEEIVSELTSRMAPASFVSMGNEDLLYQNDFLNLQSKFGLGLDKVVLISREEFKANQAILGRRNIILRSLKFGTGTPYGFWHEEYGIAGSTPEKLYSLKNNLLKTLALAGTSRKGQEDELLRSEKDRHEHNLVIQDLEEKLSRFSSEIEMGVTGILNFKDIIHLKTEIEAKVSDSLDLGKLTNLLSPTAALGGYPKERALRFLQSSGYQQKYPQRYFGSAFGVVSPEFTQFVVMIRNVQWRNNIFYIESGGGVLPESILESELEEINLKRSVIRTHYL